MNHLADRDLKGFLAGRLGAKSRQRVVRHLISHCQQCPERLRAMLPSDFLRSTSVAEEEDVYDACIDRAVAAARSAVSRWEKERDRKERGIDLVRAKGW